MDVGLFERATGQGAGEDRERDVQALEAHVERVESVAAQAAELVRCAPRMLSRAGGDSGRAWDRLCDALESIDPDLRQGAISGQPAEHEPRRGVIGRADAVEHCFEPDPLPMAGAALVAVAAARVQRAVDMLDDVELSVAWDLLLASLVGG